ncbi:PspC domain-containing protein [Nocardioides sp. AE5]|uniref:PspC domain-containing protein n=1 Tax=Nocardioides sp. AE5 TaxID=2962573 RepID=UPI002882734C|nr:PspC domain-containing protein [Nocardioides sp. AE5]MDT0202005.1 PspC domain-containing protein [Nocardioides sp. AE5]
MNSSAPRRLLRSRDNQMIGGVCAGLANYFHLDTNLVRVLTVIAALFSFGTALVAYLAAWVLMPNH